MTVLVVLAVGAGCGSGGAPPATAPTQAQPSSSFAPDAGVDLEAAVRAYSAAFLGGEGDVAYDLLSQRCKERQPRVGFIRLVSAAAVQYGPLDIETLRVDQVAGGLGRVTYTYARPELDQRGEPWVHEGGAWRVDDC